MRKKRLLTSAILLGLVLGMIAPNLLAEEVHTTKLTLHPTAPPVPALKYHLLPNYLEKQPGNAAILYQRAITFYNSISGEVRDRDDEQCQKWLEMPLHEIPLEEAKKLPFDYCLKLLGNAALRGHCDWELPLRVENPYLMMLPHLGPIRPLFRMQQLQTRCYLAEGKLREATQNIQNEFAMAQHVAESPILVCGVVGITMANWTCRDIETAIQQPDCPNLYWSLAQLPRPLISLQESLQVEGDLPCMLMPELKNIDDDSLGADYWRKAMLDANDRITETGMGQLNGPQKAMGVTALIIAAYPKARQSLIDDWGYTAEQIDAMPTVRVVALHTLKTYELIRDEHFKWLALPDSEWVNCHEGLMKLNWKKWRDKESFPLASLFLPAVDAAKSVEIRLTQNIDRLRLIEAIRLYAYHHDGQLPERLDQITEVPVPVNPATNEPFPYRLEGDTAIIEHAQPGWPKRIERYEIQIAK